MDRKTKGLIGALAGLVMAVSVGLFSRRGRRLLSDLLAG